MIVSAHRQVLHRTSLISHHTYLQLAVGHICISPSGGHVAVALAAGVRAVSSFTGRSAVWFVTRYSDGKAQVRALLLALPHMHRRVGCGASACGAGRRTRQREQYSTTLA